MKEKSGGRSGNDPDADNVGSERSGSFDHGGRRRSTPQTPTGFGTIGPASYVDIGSVERVRRAIIKADHRRDWGDWFVIAGATLLAVSQIVTLVLASGINARANRIIENDAIRAREGGRVVERLEGKLDQHVTQSKENGRKLDEIKTAVATTTTTTKVVAAAKVERSTTSTRTSVPTTVATATTLPRTVVPTTFAPATTLPPCRFALLNICLAR